MTFGAIQKKLITKVKLEPIRRVVAAILVYTMLGTQTLTSFAATGSNATADSEGIGGATSSNGSLKNGDSDDKGTFTGKLIFMSDGAGKRSRPDLRLYVNGKADDDAVIILDKTGTYKATGSNATDSDADEIPIFDDRVVADGYEVHENRTDGFVVWTYYVENLPLYDGDGNLNHYSIRDEAYDDSTASDALFYADENSRLIGEEGVWEDGAVNLTYVQRGTLGGSYQAGLEAAVLPEEIPLVLNAADEDDMVYMGLAEGWIHTGAGTWSISDVLQYNPETGLPIEWRAKVDADSFLQFTYTNIESYETNGEYIYDGGTIISGRRTVAAEGAIQWEDEDDSHGKRPRGSAFLKLYTETGDDITEQVGLTVTGREGNSWTYRIDRLAVGETYHLVQTSPYYQTAEAVITVDESGQAPTAETLRMAPATRTYRGTIEWESFHPLHTIPDQLDFLKVYEGDTDITDTLSLQLVKQDDSSVWFYTIDGLLAEGVYTIRLEAPMGYFAEVMEYVIQPAGMRTLARDGGGIIAPFKLTPTGLHEIVIRNETEGVEAGQAITFTYTLKENGVPYNGLYQVIDSGGNISSVELGPTITLNKGESKTIQLEAQVDVEQTGSDSTLVRLLKRDVNSDKDDFRFVNTTLTTESAVVVWNDNHNEDGDRPFAGNESGLSANMSLYYRPVGGSYTLVTAGNCSEIGFTAAEFNNMFVFLSGISNDAEWNYSVYNLPTHILVSGAIRPVEYKIEVKNPDTTETVYVREAYDKGTPGSRNDSWTTILSKQLTYHASVQWLDGKNVSLTRMARNSLKGTLELWRKDTRPGSGVEEKVTIPDSFNVTEIDSANWSIKIPGLTAYDELGYPYSYFLKQAQPGIAGESGIMNKASLISGTVRYETEYENAGKHGSKEDACYENGVIKNTLKGQMEFEAQKQWNDNNRPSSARPAVAGELWRYVRGAGPETAARVLGVNVSIPKTSGAITVSAASLPVFDEDGQEYIYFINETVSGAGYRSTFNNKAPFDTQAGSNIYLYNGGTLANTLTGKVSASVTKQWKAKAVQGMQSSVTFRLQRRLAGTSDPWESVIGQIKTVDGFTSESMTKSCTFTNLEEFDASGKKYEYRVVETSVSSSLGTMVPDTMPADLTDFEYKLGEYEFIREFDAQTGRIVNRLKGDTCIEIDKTWNMDEADIADELHFHLLRDGKDICGEYLKEQNPDDYSNDPAHKGCLVMTKADDQVGQDVYHWNKVFAGLPKYDGEGAEFTYSVTESFPVGKYYDVDITYEYGKTTVGYDHKIAKVINSLAGGKGKALWVVKEWLDDGDSMHREPVTVVLRKTDASAPGGSVEINTRTLSDENAWKYRFWIAETENYDDYFVEETMIGSDKKADYDVIKALGYDDPTKSYIVTDEHIYQVLPPEMILNEKNQRVWVVNNLRVGQLDIRITKTWTDGKNNTGYPAIFQLIANGTATGQKVTLVKGSGNKWTGSFEGLEKYDDNGVVIQYEVREIAVIDGNGVEQPVGSDGMFTLGGLEYKGQLSDYKYTPGKKHHTGDLYEYEAVNSRYGTKAIVFNKLWRDYDEADGVTRPDIYLRLYRAVGSVPSDPATGEFISLLPTLKQVDNYHWTYTYTGMPMYDKTGEPYIYYAIEGMPAPVSGGWFEKYFAPMQSGETIQEATVSGREADEPFMREDGIVVNLRGGNTTLDGKKIWGNMGTLKQKDYPTISVFLYVSKWDAQTGTYGTPEAVKENGVHVSREIGPNGSGGYNSTYSFGEYPKYDEQTGEKYRYSVSEKPGTVTDPEDLNGFKWIVDSTDLVLVNTFASEQKLAVKIEKEWQGHNGVEPVDGYPVLEFELYREMQYPVNGVFVSLDYTLEKAGSSQILDMNAIGATGKVTFDVVDYYAPNGWPYIYYVREKMQNGSDFKVPGYEITVVGLNNLNIDLVENKGYKLEYGVPGGNNVVEGTWKFRNRYTMEKLKIEGTKSWKNDTGWGSISGGVHTPDTYRPDKSQVILSLYRKTKTTAPVDMQSTAVWEAQNDDSNWKYYFYNEIDTRDFDRYNTAGEEYQYFVKEEVLTAYNGVETHYIDVVNGEVIAFANMENRLETVNLLVEKKWDDANNLYKTRPTEITLKLQRTLDDINFVDVTKDGSAAAWTETIKIDKTTTIDSVTRTVKFSGLPKYHLNGSSNPPEYRYRVVELAPTDPNDKLHDYDLPDESTGYTIEKTASGYKVLFENKLRNPSTTDISVTKVWDDDNNRDGFRPTEIKVALIRDGDEVDTATLVKEPDTSKNTAEKILGEWSVTWKGWPIYKMGSTTEKSVYTIEEISRSTYYREPVVKQNGDDWTITNTHESILDLELKFKKTWNDNNDLWGKRPTSIWVELYRYTMDAPNVKEKVAGHRVDLTGAGNEWTTTFKDLPYAKEGHAGNVYSYFVKEDPVYGYQDNPSGQSTEVRPVVKEKNPPQFDGNPEYDITFKDKNGKITNEMQITNSLITTKAEVTKLWDDSSNRFLTRPENITVRLQRKPVGAPDSDYEDVIDPQTRAVWDQTIKTSGAGANACTFKDLPVYVKGTNTKYDYRVVEIEMEFANGEKVPLIDNSGGGYTVTVDKTPGTSTDRFAVKNKLTTVETKIVKKWYDDPPGYDRNAEIKSVTFTVQRQLGGGTFEDLIDNTGKPVTYEMVLPTGAEESYIFPSLPQYTFDGQEYTYRMVESYMTLNKKDGGGNNIIIPAVTQDELAGTMGVYTFGTQWQAGSSTEPSVTTVNNSVPDRYVRATKLWDDNGNQDGERPDSVTLELKYDGQSFNPKKLVVLDGTVDPPQIGATGYEEAAWTAAWQGLAAYHADNTPIVYTIEEVKMGNTNGTNVNGYNGGSNMPEYGPPSEAEADVLTVKNIRTPEMVDYQVRKFWADDDLWLADRPESVQVQLYKIVNGVKAAVGAPVTLKHVADGINQAWTYRWLDLPRYENIGGSGSDQGTAYEILYQAEEIIPADGFGYDQSQFGPNGILNTLRTTDLRVIKLWEDQDDYYDRRPAEITIQLQRSIDGINWIAVGTPEDLHIDGNNQQEISFMGLPVRDKDNRPYQYRGIEVAMDGETVVGGNALGYSVTHSHSPNVDILPGESTITNRLVTTELKGTKTWNDQSNRYGTRPDQITLELKANPAAAISGKQPATDNLIWEKNGDIWNYRFENLPKYDANGVEVVYSVEEIYLPQYDVIYDSGHINLTNTLRTVDINGTKTWIDDNNRFKTRPENLELVVRMNGNPLDPQPEIEWVKEDNIWRWKAAGLPKENIDGVEYVYTVEEKAVPYYRGSQNGYDFTNVLPKGALSVRKYQVGGYTTDFVFRVTMHVNGTDVVYTGAYKVLLGTAGWTEDGEIRQTDDAGAIKIRRDQKFILTDLPAGVSYTITEDTKYRFQTSGVINGQGVIPQDALMEASFTNSYTRIDGGGGGSGDGGGGGSRLIPSTPTIIEENPVPLGEMDDIDINIKDQEVPLGGLPQTRDSSLPYGLLLTIMLGAVGLMVGATMKRKKEEEN